MHVQGYLGLVTKVLISGRKCTRFLFLQKFGRLLLHVLPVFPLLRFSVCVANVFGRYF